MLKNKNKLFIVLPLACLLLSGCSNKKEDIPPVIDQDVLPNIDVFTTESDIFKYLFNDGLDKEIFKGTSYKRDYSSKTISYFETIEQFDKKTIERSEEGNSFLNNNLLIKGKEKITHEYDYKDDVVTNDDYKKFNTLQDGYFYKAIDYQTGKDKDSINKEKYKESDALKIDKETSLGAIATLNEYFNNYINSTIIEGADEITPTINKKDGSFSYTISKEYDNEEDVGYKYQDSYDLTLNFDKDAFLISYDFSFKENEYFVNEAGEFLNTTYPLLAIDDTYKIVYSSKEEYKGSDIDPLNYYLTDYTIQLLSSDGTSTTFDEVEATSFPYGTYLNIKIRESTPTQALDLDLFIKKSSNSEVIELKTYSDGGYVAKAVGVGKTTLTVISSSGIEKTIEINVISLPLKSIKASLYRKIKFVGDSEDLYISTNPSETLEEIEVTTSTPSLVKIIKEEDSGYYSLQYLGLGNAQVKVSSKINKDVSSTIEFTIKEKLKNEDTISSLIGKWNAPLLSENGETMIENAVSVSFTDSTNGYLLFNSDDHGYTFVKGTKYPFTYKFTDREDIDSLYFTISDITYSTDVMEFNYDDNSGQVYKDGKTARFDFKYSDSTMFGFDLQLDAIKEEK